MSFTDTHGDPKTWGNYAYSDVKACFPGSSSLLLPACVCFAQAVYTYLSMHGTDEAKEDPVRASRPPRRRRGWVSAG